MRKISVSLLLLPVWAIGAGPETSDKIKITTVNGPQEVQATHLGKPLTVRAGDVLVAGDEVIAGKGQVVALQAYDGSTWKIAPDTRLKLEARKPEKQGFFYWTFQLVRGAMWGLVEKQENSEGGFRLKVRTPTAAMGVRGTEYLMDGDELRSGLDVLEGRVWWGKKADFTPGSYREVLAGEHAEIDAAGTITVGKSEGDKTFLVKKYGLMLSLASDKAGGDLKKNSNSPADCLARGKGWKSEAGSSLGECINEK